MIPLLPVISPRPRSHITEVEPAIKASILYDKVSEREGGFNINESVLLNISHVISAHRVAESVSH